MKFRITKDELIRALSRVQGIVEKRSTNPIIANVLLEVNEDGMRVAATDTEVSFVGRYDVDCETPGRVTVGARQLYDIARLAPTDEIRVEVAEGTFNVGISSGKAFFNILGLPAGDFPDVPDPGEIAGLEMSAAELGSLIDKTLFAISGDDTRTGLNGAYVEQSGENGASLLRLVATDGHRLSLCGKGYDGEFNASGSLLLPKKGLAELRKLLEDSEGTWRISFTESQATFQRGAIAFSMRLLEGDFPDYNQVIPGQWQRRLLMNREALSQTLRRVSILASEKSHPVRFAMGDGLVTVRAQQPGMGEAREELEAQTEGSEVEIGFNARYFRDALQALDTDTVIIEVGDSLSPCLIRPGEGSHDELYVIMPMRLE